MLKDYIDVFFDSMSDDVLKEKWEKYQVAPTSKNHVKVSQLIDGWNGFYENIFPIEEFVFDSTQNISFDKSEELFGLFYLCKN